MFCLCFDQVKNEQINVDAFRELSKKKFGNNNQEAFDTWIKIGNECLQPNEADRCQKAAKFLECFYIGLDKHGYNIEKDFN